MRELIEDGCRVRFPAWTIGPKRLAPYAVYEARRLRRLGLWGDWLRDAAKAAAPDLQVADKTARNRLWETMRYGVEVDGVVLSLVRVEKTGTWLYEKTQKIVIAKESLEELSQRLLGSKSADAGGVMAPEIDNMTMTERLALQDERIEALEKLVAELQARIDLI